MIRKIVTGTLTTLLSGALMFSGAGATELGAACLKTGAAQAEPLGIQEPLYGPSYKVMNDGDIFTADDMEDTKFVLALQETSHLNLSIAKMSDLVNVHVSTVDGKDVYGGYKRVSYGQKCDIYLIAGIYYVEFDITGCIGGDETEVSVSVEPTKDTYEETVVDRSVYYRKEVEQAQEIKVGEKIKGTIVTNEFWDVYKFTNEYSNIPMTFSIKNTSPEGKHTLNYGVYPVDQVPPFMLQFEQEDWVEPHVAYEYGIEAGKESQEKTWIIPRGTYYLMIYNGGIVNGQETSQECLMESLEEGATYSFTLDYAPTALSTCYVNVGETAALLSGRYARSLGGKLTWESRKASVAKPTNDNPDTVYGVKPGTTTLFGHGSYFTIGRDGRRKLVNSYVSVFTVVEYKDVKHGSDNGKDPYYYVPVYWATDEGITGGVKDSDGVVRTFNPQGICNRAQMVSFLWRMAGCPEPKTKSNFKDVSTKAYYYNAVCWAQENGITGGYSDGTFGPNNACTRGQAVTFLYRMAGQPKVTSTSNFKDVKKGTYYYNAVLWAEKAGITGGYSDNTFRPDNQCTRAQMVTFLYRYNNYIN